MILNTQDLRPLSPTWPPRSGPCAAALPTGRPWSRGPGPGGAPHPSGHEPTHPQPHSQAPALGSGMAAAQPSAPAPLVTQALARLFPLPRMCYSKCGPQSSSSNSHRSRWPHGRSLGGAGRRRQGPFTLPPRPGGCGPSRAWWVARNVECSGRLGPGGRLSPEGALEAITNDHKQGGLNDRNSFSPSSGSQKP